MASATIMSTSSPSLDLPQPGCIIDQHGETALVTEWAHNLQYDLQLIQSYEKIEDIPSDVILDEYVMNAPRRRAADPAAARLAHLIAETMYPTHVHGIHGPIIQYERDIVMLRRYVCYQRRRTIDENTKRKESISWRPRITNQGAWNPESDPVSLQGAPSLPMPVEIADQEDLVPFFSHLANNGNHTRESTAIGQSNAILIEEPYYNTPAIEFKRGVAYSDGRMDLCKMVLGPNSIGALMNSLKTNNFITHFLLGNNIIGPHGAKCIADFLKEKPNQMDTWYLAGNCIDADSVRLLVDEWIQSSSVTNIWLKRNPLGSASAKDIFRLITETQNLRTLDLDQTELGDTGVIELFTGLSNHNQPVALRHIYLNAIGIGQAGAAAIAEYLASPLCKLEAIYATNNPLGDAGLANLAIGLKANKSMRRITLASIGAGDDGIISLCKALKNHPKFEALDIGQSFSTEDLGSKYNWVTDRAATAIFGLIKWSPKLVYLRIDHCPMTNKGLADVLDAVVESSTLQYYSASTILPQARDAAAVHAGQRRVKVAEHANQSLLSNVQRTYGKDTTYQEFLNNHKRWLINDETDVRKIDSVYRNRDAGLARRGLKILDKWWDEGDDTLQTVMNAVGPVCTRRKVSAWTNQS